MYNVLTFVFYLFLLDLFDDPIVKNCSENSESKAIEENNDERDKLLDEKLEKESEQQIEDDPMELDEDMDTNTIIEVNNLNSNNLNNPQSNTDKQLTDDELIVQKARMQLDFLKQMEQEQVKLIAKQKAIEQANQMKSQSNATN